MDLSDPVHMMFPYSGGPIYGGTVVGKHHETPYVSPEKMDLSIIYMDYHVNYHLITFSPNRYRACRQRGTRGRDSRQVINKLDNKQSSDPFSYLFLHLLCFLKKGFAQRFGGVGFPAFILKGVTQRPCSD